MSTHRFLDFSGIRSCLPLICATAALLHVPAAHADFLIAVSSAVAEAGSTGNTLEVDLTNTGTSAVTFGGFAFGISTSSPSIAFTGATTATTTAPYIFASDSLFGPDIATSIGLSLTAADASALGADSVAAGATVGLGKVSFDVASGASLGPVTVTLAGYPTTSLSDNMGNNLPFTGLNGTIVVVASPSSPVPEPSTLLLFSTGLAFLAVRASGRRRLRLDAKRQATV
jgi:hypothetical protein